MMSREKRPLSGVMGAVSSLAELVTKNFWLKVLSLAIALVVYGVLRPEAEEKPILPYVGMDMDKPWSQPAHSVVIDHEPAHAGAPQDQHAATNGLQRAESEPKGTAKENGSERQ